MLSLVTLLIIIISILIIGKRNNVADWGHWGTNVLDGWIRIYCRRFHRQGNQTIEVPTQPHVLLAPNHLSGIDPFLLITATDRPIRFMIAKEEYEKPVLNWMFRAAGCIPVDRSGRVEKAFRQALRAIQQGELVSLFPQGGIHRDDMPRERIKPGIIKLSQLSNCYILPIRINGIGAPGTVASSVITRSKVTFDLHRPISPQEALNDDFRESMGSWLLGKKEQIVESCVARD